MFFDLAGSPALCRKLLACWLCLLAFTFAIEAKTAWYGPAAGPSSVIRAAKARRADTPKVVLHGAPTPAPLHPAVPFLNFAALALALPAGSEFRSPRKATRGALTFAAASFHSPQLFFRPPPTL